MSTSWSEVEILDLLPLAPDEASLIEMHSVLNTVSLIVGELNLIGQALEKDLEWMKGGLDACRDVVAALRSRERAIRFAGSLAGFRLAINRDIDRALSIHENRRGDPGILESLGNIDSVFAVLTLRAREILARSSMPERWEKFEIYDLHRAFLDFFAAIEKNSKGRFRIVYNQPRLNQRDYWVHLDISSHLGDVMLFPPVLADVMRDLMANARKYSLPGASISAELHQSAQGIRFVVQDTGRGIPAGEIQSVVTFGKRGSNAGDVRTRGGGFGLTKALFVTKQFKGRMWIASRIGIGTRVRIEIPAPMAEIESRRSEVLAQQG